MSNWDLEQRINIKFYVVLCNAELQVWVLKQKKTWSYIGKLFLGFLHRVP
jgi:hypothetical protein